MQPPPRSPDDGENLDPTIAMPQVEVPLARPVSAASAPPPPTPASPPAPASPPPYRPAPAYAPVPSAAAAPPSSATVVAERPRFVFGNPIGYTFARFVAFAVDLALISFVVTTLIYALFAINPFTGLPTNSESGFDATLAIGAAVALAYMWLAEALFGTTIGKLVTGLHVYALRGRFVGLGRSFVRNIVRPVDLLVIGWILAALPGHRRLGDLLGGTVVARSPLRAFAPLVGWILVIVLVGVPFLVVPVDRVLAGIVAFGEFVPALAWRLWTTAATLLNGVLPH